MVTTNFTRLFSNSGLTSFTMKAIVLLSLIFFVGCGQSSLNPANPPSVHAGPPVPQETLCTSAISGQEQFTHGTLQPDNSTVFETADYLQYASPVCPSSGYTMRASFTLQFSHHVQLVDMQMGSGESNTLHEGQAVSSKAALVPEIFEWAWWAQFDTPDGHHYEFFQQFDKHSDVQGNQNVKIPLPHGMTLPAGTVVTLFRPPSAAIDSATQSHATGQKVELVGY